MMMMMMMMMSYACFHIGVDSDSSNPTLVVKDCGVLHPNRSPNLILSVPALNYSYYSSSSSVSVLEFVHGDMPTTL